MRLIDTAFAYNDSLKRLNIDYIDLLLLHHPGENDVRAYKAMEKAVKQGDSPFHQTVQLVYRGAAGISAAGKHYPGTGTE